MTIYELQYCKDSLESRIKENNTKTTSGLRLNARARPNVVISEPAILRILAENSSSFVTCTVVDRVCAWSPITREREGLSIYTFFYKKKKKKKRK